MDGVLCDFMHSVKEVEPEIDLKPEDERKKIIKSLCLSQGFYLNLPPMQGAIEAWHRIGEKYDNYILSAPKWGNPFSYLEKRVWVEKHLGSSAWKKLILSHNKGLLLGDFLIDDRLKYGVDKFTGKHIHYGTNEFPDFDSVTKFILND